MKKLWKHKNYVGTMHESRSLRAIRVTRLPLLPCFLLCRWFHWSATNTTYNDSSLHLIHLDSLCQNHRSSWLGYNDQRCDTGTDCTCLDIHGELNTANIKSNDRKFYLPNRKMYQETVCLPNELLLYLMDFFSNQTKTQLLI